MITACTTTPEREPGTVNIAPISNIYTIDQIDSLSKKNIDDIIISKNRIQQHEQITATDAVAFKIAGKAIAGASNKEDDTSKLNSTLKDAFSQSEIKEKAGTPELAYRYSIDDLFSNYEYKTIAQLKHTYDSLIRRGYKIFFIPLRFSVNPGKTTIENYYLEIKYEIEYDKNKMTVQLVDLFPTKIFDNRMIAYSGVIQQVMALTFGGELNAPKAGGKAQVDYQQLKNLRELLNNIQLIPVVISFIEDKDDRKICFGWDIYPEQVCVKNELRYIQHHDNYNYIAVVAVRSRNEEPPSPKIIGRYVWKMITEKSGDMEDDCNKNISEGFPVVLQKYNPISNLVPTITSCQKINEAMIKMEGTDLDRIVKERNYENPKVSLLIGKKAGTSRITKYPVGLSKLFISKDSKNAIGILKDGVSIEKDEMIYAVEYSYYTDPITHWGEKTDTGIFIINNNVTKSAGSDSLVSSHANSI